MSKSRHTSSNKQSGKKSNFRKTLQKQRELKSKFENERKLYIKRLEIETEAGNMKWVNQGTSRNGSAQRARYISGDYSLMVISTKNVDGVISSNYTILTPDKIYYELKGQEISKLARLIVSMAKEKANVQMETTSEKKKVVRTKEIGRKDIVVVKDIFDCVSHGHVVSDVNALFEIKKENEEVVKIRKCATYCLECKEYYILRSIYNEILVIGTPQCKILDGEGTYESKDSFTVQMNNAIGPLKQSGYSVSKEDGLSKQARQALLENMIDRGVVTRGEIMSYLTYFADLHKGQSNMQEAVSKWREDFEYIKNLDIIAKEYGAGKFQE